MKELSAAAIVRKLRQEMISCKVRRIGVKYINYRGYEIHVHPAYFKGNPKPCFIGQENNYEAYRTGLDKAKTYVDEQIKLKFSRVKIKCKVKKVKQ